MLFDTHPGVRLAIGVSGSGKTHGIRQSVYRAIRAFPVIVIDRMREWSSVPQGIAPLSSIVSTVAIARSAIATGKRLLIVQCTDVVKEAEAACLWARDRKGLAGVAIPEAHRVASNGGALPPGIEDVATAWRHYDVALWLDTQRLALISRTLTEQARELRIYTIVGDNDMKVVRELGGRELESAIRQCGVRLAAGEPGWHVRLGVSRLPPYAPTRDA